MFNEIRPLVTCEIQQSVTPAKNVTDHLINHQSSLLLLSPSTSFSTKLAFSARFGLFGRSFTVVPAPLRLRHSASQAATASSCIEFVYMSRFLC